MISESSTNSPPLWLDCDTGHDDALAILLSAQHPSVNLLGISTIYGNASLPNTTHNTRAILKAINREDVPVFIGASKPFCRVTVAAPDIHGESGLDGTTCLPTPTVPARIDITAVEAMYRALIAQPPNTAYLVATGACTNIALLFAVHPELAEHIAGLSIMGGAIGGGFSNAPMGIVHGEGERFGNWTPFAEFNIYIDPESASSIFSNPVLAKKTTLIPLDLTHQFLATKQVQDGLLHGFDHIGHDQSQLKIPMVRKLFHEILTFFAKTYADVFGLNEGPPTHDPLAVAALLFPEAFHDNDGERYTVQVITEGEHGSSDQIRAGGSQCGRTVATLLLPLSEGVRIPRSLERARLWHILDECLARAG
ncbi:Putative inosine/uridine-preferring nucleoside hydrolase domain, ribonucleoside hydrolase [Septoria linicola]|uniref:Inosine/uridine-preferring nucleoside hydrolase domain, ribonucleoside hydrolase n=1 Tax=Septoria linicola TaxID=215465 RepID=A0A9Q9EFZ2_9PEZI|nr:putative inosine/uridine-preferring nucleoside hydrolase domain, ribonucleoside hydrolase [Septoria linicola]USW47763.1 Putative inosine/uridine-preferring nucleoside hydrolase domain, ribonucleoside hydrolase [Septoria linicola]